MELSLVLGLDVSLEVTGFAKCSIAVRTLMRPLTLMDSLDVDLEGTGLAECSIAVRTLIRS